MSPILHWLTLAELAQQIAPDEVNLTYVLPAALMLLLPLGLILLISSAMPEDRAPATAIYLLITWAIAALAYFAVGFAFHFGGIAQVSTAPGLSGLYWEWYPFDPSVDLHIARLWGLIALQGWLMLDVAATPAALHLFASHLALVGVAAIIPAGVLIQRGRSGVAMLIGLLVGAVLYPLPGNWVWGGGWLFNLGESLGLGHGLVDFGGAGVVFLLGSLAALAALLVFKPTPTAASQSAGGPAEVVVALAAANNRLTVYDETGQPTAEALPVTLMPSAYLPILGVMGALLALAGWLGLTSGAHLPTAVNFSPAQAAVNGLLAALAAVLGVAGYSYLTTRKIDPLMTARGLIAGLIVATAGAPFIPTWMLVVAGGVIGMVFAPLVYLFNQGLRLADELGTLATYGVSAVVSLALVGLLADGQAGQGWNGVGPADYHGVAGQGVTGLAATAGFAADWPGQFQAQMVGLGAIIIFALGLSFGLMQMVKSAQTAWTRSGLELARPEKPAAEKGAQMDVGER